MRVDAVGLAAPASAATRVGHQLASRRAATRSPRAIRNRSNDARDVPAVLERPDPLAAEPARPDQQRGEAPGADLDRLLAEQLAGRRRRPRRSCASACGCPHRARSLTSSTSTSTEVDARRTRLAGGAATLLSSHAETSPTGDERHSERQSGPTGRQPERESARRRSGAFSSASDVTDARITTASVKAGAPSRSPSVGGCRGDTGAPVGSPTRRQTTAARYAGGEHGRTRRAAGAAAAKE